MRTSGDLDCGSETLLILRTAKDGLCLAGNAFAVSLRTLVGLNARA